MLNEQKGNMYEFITHTFNSVKGKCEIDCTYCYMKRWGELKPQYLNTGELRTDFGTGKFIFVGSSTDMFAPGIPDKWIYDTLKKCREHKNRYLFQSKNPIRFMDFRFAFPENSILATTVESNRHYPEISNAPPPCDRMEAMRILKDEYSFETMLTIEPVLDFDYDEFIELIAFAEFDHINIGADSCNKNLPEPSKEKLLKLIETITPHQKKNLKRLIK